MLVGFLLYSAHMHPDISLIFQLLSIPTTFLVTHELQDRTQMHCCNAKILGFLYSSFSLLAIFGLCQILSSCAASTDQTCIKFPQPSRKPNPSKRQLSCVYM